MRVSIIFVGLLLHVNASAAETHDACTIQSVRERVLSEHSGPQPPRDQPGTLPAPDMTIYQVRIACSKQDYFAVFTGAGQFARDAFKEGARVRVVLDGREIRLQSATGLVANGRIAARD